ncbi:prepilin-type N-terminal cleavage/methylation domain-containing protein [Noviluteimonas gilva]|uniref:Prepilin-type N-terminal cleavage/methylation domain-containing protein n=1 Tax=Noviluteimonas gilva TaxID=2682097 RepID=A0A7C9LJJ3_9GAMM|nr:prepilin-type N-terminal cleavage/methylation domain-containing protein [Lysobacter gilvus]MUV15720.1 prepilin-type N-terminal cleavage/methylation domain-containing protein [Lysobacter gilvus]
MLNVRRPARGFTLIELMVSLVLALVVMAAVVTLVVAVIRSNRQTLQSTRLNQELRATLNLVANDLRRARSINDPLSAAVGPNPYANIQTPNGNTCAIYGYDGMHGARTWHVLRVDNNGRLGLRSISDATPPANCGDGTFAQLSSNQVDIRTITFQRVPANAPDDFVRQIDVTITGRLADTNPSAPPIERTMRQTVYVRSVGTGI